ncbi:hypothetical protein AB2L27_06350 [Kineococcus sp. LSe6-4]|uniref:Amidohydrolase family protein n=1 Tax=Kineococcus halophytocola TaxID=3234027 RepID=A0ABV4GYI9_9ACTN
MVLAHAGGALPMLAGRLLTLCEADWVPHDGVDEESVRRGLRAFYYDTAISGTAQAMGPLTGVTDTDHIVYGSDFGAPCASAGVLERTIEDLFGTGAVPGSVPPSVRGNGARVFPRVLARLGRG